MCIVDRTTKTLAIFATGAARYLACTRISKWIANEEEITGRECLFITHPRGRVGGCLRSGWRLRALSRANHLYTVKIRSFVGGRRPVTSGAMPVDVGMAVVSMGMSSGAVRFIQHALPRGPHIILGRLVVWVRCASDALATFATGALVGGASG